ncbi:MAG: LytTR family transcriptional regulator DNA-binding domain-containing protein [Ignavibacteriaceae bacterium]|jgi:DNA-binding LytR/AlgR family response regulator|nr:LytTR family transcriptional regulator DNA-binding domain-containing protein [Ignavibacteriaceae bacterium]
MNKEHQILNKGYAGKKLHYNAKQAPVSIDIEKILFIKGAGSYSDVFVEDRIKAVTIPCFLCFIENYLKEDDFLRCHNSWVVNARKIETLCTKEKLVIISKWGVPVSKMRWNLVKWVLADKGIEIRNKLKPGIINLRLTEIKGNHKIK